MEIVLYLLRSELRERVQRAVERTLCYKLANLLSLYPASFETRPQMLEIIRPEGDYIVVSELWGEAPPWEDYHAIQRRGRRVRFLFIGDRMEHCIQAVREQMELLDYILLSEIAVGVQRADDALEARLKGALFRAAQSIHTLFDGIFVMEYGGTEYRFLPFDVIYYIETIKNKHYCTVVYEGGSATVRESIKDLSRRVDDRFYVCRSSTIANLARVERIDLERRCLIFRGDLACGFSESRKEILRQAVKNRFLSKTPAGDPAAPRGKAARPAGPPPAARGGRTPGR